MSNSLQLHGLQSPKLLCPWDSPGKNTEVGCYALLKGIFPIQELKGLAVSGQEDPLEKGIATHSRILAWRIPWTEEPGGLQSMGLRRVGYD